VRDKYYRVDGVHAVMLIDPKNASAGAIKTYPAALAEAEIRPESFVFLLYGTRS
jgi:hypothetical protein